MEDLLPTGPTPSSLKSLMHSFPVKQIVRCISKSKIYYFLYIGSNDKCHFMMVHICITVDHAIYVQ